MKTNQEQQNIPEGWRFEPLKKVATFLDNERIPLSQDQRATRRGSYPYYGASGIIDYVDDFIFDGYFVLLGEDGANILDRSSRLAFIAHGKIWVNNHAHVLRPKENMMLYFLSEYLEKIDYRAFNTGSAQPKLNRTVCEKIPVLVPPINEQKRIVAVLETWDQAIEKLKRKIEVKKEIKKGLMQELLTGKKRFSGFSDKWKQIEIGNFCEIKRGGSPRPIQDYMTEDENGLNWLKIGDVPKGSRYIFRTTGKIRKEGLNKTTVVNEGDFILSNSMSFGRPYIMKLSACIHDGWLALKNISSEVNKDFLYYLLSSELIQAKFRSISAGSGVLNLKKESVAEVVVQIPSLQEQNPIAKLLTASDDEIDGLEQKISILKDQKKYLLNNLMTGTIRTPESLSIPK